MKRMMLAFLILFLIIAIIGTHLFKVYKVSNQITEMADEVFSAYEEDDFKKVYEKTNEILNVWQDNRFWATLTLATEQIDEIEISLEQSIKYAKLEAKPDFIGEFKMFCMLVEHIPRQEGLSIEELF